MKSLKIIKWSIVVIITIIYTYFSFSFGFWLTGDMHSGGPLVGLFFTPIVFFLLKFIFFYQDIKSRKTILLSLLTFFLFFTYLIGISFLTEYLFSILSNEDSFIYKYSLGINFINWVITIILTFMSHKVLSKLIIKSKKN
ncbi:hypothetical protein [Polaribacter sp.]|uniref:hypothetical protein n=1 Tax=Polaribacter sp. TaxID=1920175 RepID=UPI004048224F